jgi:hypothetical protein
LPSASEVARERRHQVADVSSATAAGRALDAGWDRVLELYAGVAASQHLDILPARG